MQIIVTNEDIPRYAYFINQDTINFMSNIIDSSKFNDDTVSSYYLDLARKKYPELRLTCVEIPKILCGKHPIHIIDELNTSEMMDVYAGYHE